MATSLEVSKLVIASLLYNYWGKLNKLLRTYLTIAAFILIMITSMGIYGFLSAAYQDTASKVGIIDKEEISCYSCKKTLYAFEVHEQYSFNHGEVIVSICSERCKKRFFNHLIPEITDNLASHISKKPLVIYEKGSPQSKYVAVKVR